MKRLYGAIGALLVVAVVAAACSGGGSNVVNIGSKPFRTGYIHASLKVPAAPMMKRIDRMVAKALKAHHVKPHFLPGSTAEIDFKLVSVNGIANTDTSYDFSLVPSADCAVAAPSPLPSQVSTPTPMPTGYQCSVTKSAPAAADQYDIVACSFSGQQTADCSSDPLAVRLSESYTIVNVPPGQTATANFSLNPVVGPPQLYSAGAKPRPAAAVSGGNCYNYVYYNGTSLSWCGGSNAGNWRNNVYAPTWDPSNQTYSCSNYYGCYDPILNGYQPTNSDYGFGQPATPVYDTLVLNVFDKDGDIIIPASAGGTTNSNVIYLKTDGTEDDITVACNDANVKWLNSGASAVPLDNADLATSDYANGQTGATSTVINSPLDNSYEGTSGTDFAGNTVTVHSNNGAYINFTGNSASYSAGNATVSCTAVDSYGSNASSSGTYQGPNTAVYYVGLASGSVSWGSNHHRLSHSRHHR